jgi:hypothetical protein
MWAGLVADMSDVRDIWMKEEKETGFEVYYIPR